MSQSANDFPAKLIYQPVAGFIEQIASKSPAPGGGSAAALSGAVGVGLLSMVTNLTIGKKNYANVSDRFTQLREKTEDLRRLLTAQIDLDTAAFNRMRVANRLPDSTPELAAAKSREINAATDEAIRVPEQTMKLCLEGLKLATEITRDGNVNTVSDAATGAEMLWAGLEGAACNVLINGSGISPDEAIKNRDSVIKVRAEGQKLLSETRKIVSEKL